MVGVQMRKLGVMFRDLRVVGPGVGAAVRYNLTPLFYPQSITEYINTVWHTPVHEIISGFKGVVASRGDAPCVYLIHFSSWLAHENLP